ncbi:uncharacterized protein VTP21DRAFT_4821 [Calcarisporiella thermophila]|uniref:uncharacterized protein n=1 Tax=Calcarisporiella thermophila TaxID=911321 RepID=UPI003743EF23
MGVTLSAVAAAVVNLKTPAVTGKLISVISKSLTGAGAQLALAQLREPALRLLALFGAQGFLTFCHISLVSVLGENIARRLKRRVFTSIVCQDMAFFDRYKSGELVSRLTTDVNEFKHTFKQIITQGLKAVTQTIGASVQLLQLSPSLTFTLCATMPVLYALLNVYGAYLRDLSRRGRAIDGIATGLASESIQNIRTVRAFAAEERETHAFDAAANDVAKANSYLGLHVGLFQGITNFSIGCMVLVVLYYGGTLVVRNEMSGGDLMTYMISTQSTQKSLVSLGVLFGQTIKAMAAASRVFEFASMKPRIPLVGGLTPPGMNGSIEFRGVEFTYPTRPDHKVLDEFNLRILPGQMVALCGASGSGKSTIAALVERFYEPSTGDILIDGVPLRALDPSWVRRQIGYINQEPVLFATTLAENIRYGRPNATDEEVKEAARRANALDFIESFPQGFDTMVGERGVTLSGGQKQRIAIARAILKNPRVLVLDEATSALDTQSEKVVQDALEELMRGRTVLVIAHRLSTIEAADMIVVMGRVKGNIVEQGSHKQLLANKGVYYHLYAQAASAGGIIPDIQEEPRREFIS